MNILWLAAILVLAMMPSGERCGETTRAGPAGLVRPLPGVPLIAEQMEERVQNQGARDSTASEVSTYTVYRDSMGRIRIERGSACTSEAATISVLDPTIGSRVVLSVRDKIAYRVLTLKPSSNVVAYGFAGMGEALPAGDWTSTTENLGRTMIEGNEFEGTRILQSMQGEPTLTNKVELWDSFQLKITGLAIVSGPFGTHSARLQKLQLRDPDPQLFAFPPDYKIIDLNSSSEIEGQQ